MLKTIRATAAALIASASIVAMPTGATAASDNSANDVSAFCRAYADFFGVSVGECVSSFRANNDAAAYCRWLDEVGFLDFWGINRGQCVSFYAHNKL